VEPVASANQEAFEAWNGPLFDRWIRFREVVTAGLGAHGEEALRLHPPGRGEHVLDIGCGLGDTTQRMAALVGADGSVLGVDVADRFVEIATEEAAEAGVENVDFLTADVQMHSFERRFDYAFSRFGTMFFANPVPALRNVREALHPGGRLCLVVWRRKLDNDWLHRAEVVVEDYLDEPEDSDEPTCGPGPFSMAGADTTSDILIASGFEAIELRRCDIEILIGNDLEQAVELMMALGPAGEVIRLWGEKADSVRPKITEALLEAMAEFERPEGVIAPASTWIVSARSPA
jgi:SAM-dependent methyltransferase